MSRTPKSSSRTSASAVLSSCKKGVFRETRTGSLVTPGDQVIPATRRSLEAPCAAVFEVEGGRIKSELYYDQVELLTQLGLMPAPAAAAS